jgi:hypothetical protein
VQESCLFEKKNYTAGASLAVFFFKKGVGGSKYEIKFIDWASVLVIMLI